MNFFTAVSTLVKRKKVQLSEEQIALEVFHGLEDTEFSVIGDLKRPEDMTVFHHGAGRHIRNHYKLWERGYKPTIVDGVDVAEDHPDAISGRILERVWELVQIQKAMWLNLDLYHGHRSNLNLR